jgi:hypothetical protein
VILDAGLLQRIQQEAVDPGAIGLGVGDEQIVDGCRWLGHGCTSVIWMSC